MSTATVSPGPEGGWQRRRRLIRNDIEEVALDLFAGADFDSVTADQIAAAVGISVRTFFRYFATKEDVLLAEPRRFVNGLCDAIRRRPPEESVLDAVRAVVGDGTYWEPSDRMLGLRLRDSVARSPGIEHRIIGTPELMEPVILTIADRLGVDAETDLRPAVYAAALQGAMTVAIRVWGESTETDDLNRLFAESLDILAEFGAGAAPKKGARGRSDQLWRASPSRKA